jgi:hypothetical protein
LVGTIGFEPTTPTVYESPWGLDNRWTLFDNCPGQRESEIYDMFLDVWLETDPVGATWAPGMGRAPRGTWYGNHPPSFDEHHSPLQWIVLRLAGSLSDLARTLYVFPLEAPKTIFRNMSYFVSKSIVIVHQAPLVMYR